MKKYVDVEAGEIGIQLRGFERKARAINTSVIAEEMALRVDDLIQSEGAEGTQGEWDPLMRSTLRRNPRRMAGMILQATGLLANVQQESGPDFALVRSPASYTGYHITGTRHMARRDPLAIDMEAAADAAAAIVLEDLER